MLARPSCNVETPRPEKPDALHVRRNLVFLVSATVPFGDEKGNGVSRQAPTTPRLPPQLYVGSERPLILATGKPGRPGASAAGTVHHRTAPTVPTSQETCRRKRRLNRRTGSFRRNGPPCRRRGKRGFASAWGSGRLSVLPLLLALTLLGRGSPSSPAKPASSSPINSDTRSTGMQYNEHAIRDLFRASCRLSALIGPALAAIAIHTTALAEPTANFLPDTVVSANRVAVPSREVGSSVTVITGK